MTAPIPGLPGAPTPGEQPPDRPGTPSLDELLARVSALSAERDREAELVERLTRTVAGEPDEEETAPEAPQSMCILALDDAAYAEELRVMTPWVDQILLRTYGRETTSGRPWCTRWPEHEEAVARIHAAWLAWQSLTDPEAGATGPSIWQRDHLEQLLAHLRSPDGPFGACTTSPERPHHRLLPAPAFTDPDSLPPIGLAA